MSRFCADMFKAPSKEHSVVYSWVWSAAMTRTDIDRQLADFAKAGIGGIYILPEPPSFRPKTMRTFLSPPYLSEAFFELVAYALETAKGYGMELWLYDEGGWPSGGACGHTRVENKEAAETVLVKSDVSVARGETYMPPADKTAFIGCNRVTNAFVATEDVTVCEYGCTQVEDGHLNRVDSTNGGVVDTFIANTYEPYYAHLKEAFGRDISMIFTDEPSVIGGLMPKNIFSLFSDKYGYDLHDFLPVLQNADLAKTSRQEQARIDYGRLVGELFYENYCKKLADWCHAHGVRFGGHLDLDHLCFGGVLQQYFSHLHALSAFDVPGVDVIWQQIKPPHSNEPPVAEGSPFFPRIAASAARQTGKKQALTESFAVYGDALTPDEMRYVLNYQAIRGINVFNIMLMSCTTARTAALTERPVFTPAKPGFYNLKHLNAYFARLAYLLRLGERVCDTALYHPSADFWGNSDTRNRAMNAYDALGASLEKKNVDFDIIDDYGVARAEVTSWGLKLGDALYRHIAVPDCRFMPPTVIDKIAPFIGVGIPTLPTNSPFLRVMVRKTGTETLWFVFNEGEESVRETLPIEGEKLYRLDLQSGEIYAAEYAEVSLVCGEMAVFLATDEQLPCGKDGVAYAVEVCDFKPISAKQFVIDNEGVCMRAVSPDKVAEPFSGEITFAASYALPAAPKAGEKYRLVLSNTAVTASVAISGKKLADFGMTPMVAVIDGDDILQEGVIELTVANTAADEILAKQETIAAYPSAEVGPYHQKTLAFEQRRPALQCGELRIEKLQ